MRNIAVIDETFDSRITSTYQLSIQCCERSFSFAILDTIRMKYIAYKNFWFEEPVSRENQAGEIRMILNTDSYLKRPYKSVLFLYPTPVYVIVPSKLFNRDKQEAYFRFSARLHSGDKILCREVPAIDSYVLFPMPQGVIEQVSNILQEVRIFHQTCPHIREAFREAGPGAEKVYAHVHPGYLDLMLIRKGQMVLYNSYQIRNTDDLAFFTLYLFEQFNLSQEETPVALSGYTGLYPGAADFLKKYVRKVFYREWPENYLYGDSFTGLEGHMVSSLFSLAGCVL